MLGQSYIAAIADATENLVRVAALLKADDSENLVDLTARIRSKVKGLSELDEVLGGRIKGILGAPGTLDGKAFKAVLGESERVTLDVAKLRADVDPKVWLPYQQSQKICSLRFTPL